MKYFASISAEIKSPLDVDEEFLVAFVISTGNVGHQFISKSQLGMTFFYNFKAKSCGVDSLQLKLEFSKVL